jgi:uracil DNA glycosylase
MTEKYISPLPKVLAVVTCCDTGHENNDAYDPIMQKLYTLHGWYDVLGKMQDTAVLKWLISAMQRFTQNHEIIAPLPHNYFKPMEGLSSNNIQVVFVGQDPYPSVDKSPELIAKINKMSHYEVEKIIGPGYETWKLCNPKPWPQHIQETRTDDTSPRVQICAVPYAMGRSFAYPSICMKVPGSYENIMQAVKNSGYQRPKMDPELLHWERQGVFMMNACPILAEGTSKNPNLWTVFSARILESIAKQNPYCVFVLLGNSAKLFKKNILEACSNACVIETTHPSRRSNASGAFLSADVFLRINQFRKTISDNRGSIGGIPELPPIEW